MKKYKNCGKKLKFILKECQKLGFLPQIGKFFFLESNIKSKTSFLNQTIYVLKFWL